MMEKCIGRIVDWLVQRGEAEEADRELYAYALKNILNDLADNKVVQRNSIDGDCELCDRVLDAIDR